MNIGRRKKERKKNILGPSQVPKIERHTFPLAYRLGSKQQQQQD
jgi:hypothetical protein